MAPAPGDGSPHRTLAGITTIVTPSNWSRF
jgi:hypothetical protein